MEIELADAVAGVRAQLVEAAARSTDEQLGFLVASVEMEFTVELKADARVKAGFKAWVVNGSVEAGVARGRTQKVKVTLTPRSTDGRDLLISAGGSTVLIPDDELSGHQGR